METLKISIVNEEGSILEFEAKVADEPDEQVAGFQNIDKSIVEKTLILFIFPYEIDVKFHMRNVETSLDIAFVKSDGTIIGIIRMDPDPEKTYGISQKFKYAIEAPLGFFQRNNITAGKSHLLVD
ncbi:MAG: DUF192 domain-containing protein [Thermoproteota archaeon]